MILSAPSAPLRFDLLSGSKRGFALASQTPSCLRDKTQRVIQPPSVIVRIVPSHLTYLSFNTPRVDRFAFVALRRNGPVLFSAFSERSAVDGMSFPRAPRARGI
jgi:hypothetical protein